MGLYEAISGDLTSAIKGRDAERLSVLRGLKAAIKNKQVELRLDDLTDEQIFGVIKSEVKKRKEAIEKFVEGSRQDLAAKEEAELKMLSDYLPPQLSEKEIKEVLAQVIQDLSASGPKDLGKVMKSAMAKFEGRADGREVNRLARELLS
ncbi:MAG: GatB/YqeY domain-containing protein [Deltaproteobacteria bacterium]|nr:GatB/YqeY domain-containing protein [Deltaproteobacteria bacterium]RLB31349.1 MAG: GatB/YqeY domain-containing protein [Deltaproteobacteria bacterium]